MAEDIPDIKQMYLDSQEYKLGAYQELRSLTDAYKELLGADYGEDFYAALNLAGYSSEQIKDINNASNNIFEPYLFKPSENITFQSRPQIPWSYFNKVYRGLAGTTVEEH